ncbi:uncharacterized protein lrrfip1a isoform X5 [Pseudoliparis swirei]|uniref:uncharacterized protein lrrfip1a isoform X5 n=1 Tax=Pseudoliparis swirei TaxID=2059687 RepID=UPI0024BDA84F|nr:uncharacterized protein lrrfip1a isoform X5 [Pseudoliparis swirei]
MGTQGTGRKRSSKKEKSTAEDDALNLIARDAEARLAAKRAARAEAREIRMKELERQQKELSDDDERMSVGSRGSVRSDLDAVGAYGGGDSLRKSKKKKKHKHKDKDRNGHDDDHSVVSSRSSRLSDESRASRSSRLELASSRLSDDTRASRASRLDLQPASYASSDLYSFNGLTSSRTPGSAFNGYKPLEYTSYRSSGSRASSRAGSARVSPVEHCSSVASYLRSAAAGGGGLPRDLDDVTIPDFPDAGRFSATGSRGRDVEDRDYLEKGSRAASALTAASLSSVGATSLRRGSGETAITIDAETSIREIKEIHELKDQIQDVETKYTQNLKEVKDAFVEVEEKYRKAMVSNAQLDNDKNNLMYQVDTLKDSLMELEELLFESRRGYEEKVKDHDREKHAHTVLQFQFGEVKETLKQSEELLNDIRQLRIKQEGFVREISDLQETVEWKDKKIGALERQKEYTDAIRIERDELREEAVKLKDIVKKHGIVLSPDLTVNGDIGEAEVGGSPSGDAATRPAPDSHTTPSEGNSILGNTEDTPLRSSGEEEVDPERRREMFEDEKENPASCDALCNVAAVSTPETSSEEQPTEEQTCLEEDKKTAAEEDNVEESGLGKDLNVDNIDQSITEAKCIIIGSPGFKEIGTRSEEIVPETKSPQGGDLGETSHPDVGETSHPDVGETSHPDVGEISHPDVGEKSHPGVGETSHPDVGETSHPDVGETSHPDVGETSHPDVGETSHPDVGETSHPGVGETSHPDVGETSHPDVEETSHPDVGETSHPDVGETSHPDVGETSHPDVEETSHPDVGETSHPDVGETSHPDVEETSHPDVGKTSHPDLGETETKSSRVDIESDEINESCKNLFEKQENIREDDESNLLDTESCHQQKVSLMSEGLPDESDPTASNAEPQQEPENADEPQNDEAEEISGQCQPQDAAASGKKKKRKRRGKKKGGTNKDKNQQKEGIDEEKGREEVDNKSATRNPQEPEVNGSATETLKKSRVAEVKNEQDGRDEAAKPTETFPTNEPLKESLVELVPDEPDEEQKLQTENLKEAEPGATPNKERLDHVPDEQNEGPSSEAETVEAVEAVAPGETLSRVETLNDSRAKAKKDEGQTFETEEVEEVGSITSPVPETKPSTSDLIDTSKDAERTNGLDGECSSSIDNSKSETSISTTDDVTDTESKMDRVEDEVGFIDETQSECTTNNPENTFETSAKEDTEELHVQSNVDVAAHEPESSIDPESTGKASVSQSSTDVFTDVFADAFLVKSLSGSESPADMNTGSGGASKGVLGGGPEEARAEAEQDSSPPPGPDGHRLEPKAERTKLNEGLTDAEDLVKSAQSCEGQSDSCALLVNTTDAFDSVKSPLETAGGAQAGQPGDVHSQDLPEESDAKVSAEAEKVNTIDVLNTTASPKEATEIGSWTEQDHGAEGSTVPERPNGEKDPQSEAEQPHEPGTDESEGDDPPGPSLQDGNEEDGDEGLPFDFDDKEAAGANPKQEAVEEGVEVVPDDGSNGSLSNENRRAELLESVDEAGTVAGGNRVESPDTAPPDNRRARGDASSKEAGRAANEKQKRIPEEEVGVADEPRHMAEGGRGLSVGGRGDIVQPPPGEEGLDAMKQELHGRDSPKRAEPVASGQEPQQAGSGVKRSSKKGKGKGKEDCKMS